MKNLKLKRTEKKLSLKDLSSKTDIPVRVLRSYEYGARKPPLEKLVTLADALHVTTDFLLERGE